MKATLSVAEAAEVMGTSPSTIYRAIKNDQFPSKTLKVGGRYVVLTKQFLETLGLEELPTA